MSYYNSDSKINTINDFSSDFDDSDLSISDYGSVSSSLGSISDYGSVSSSFGPIADYGSMSSDFDPVSSDVISVSMSDVPVSDSVDDR